MFLRETQGGDFVSSHRPLTPYQRHCLWTPRRVFDPLDTHLAIELVTSAYFFRVFIGA